ncbi:class I SAM-dependent methyltransferase [Gordonia sputi]|nr:class I SAM-dependent methyltransferase [Gordonia sputi]
MSHPGELSGSSLMRLPGLGCCNRGMHVGEQVLVSISRQLGRPAGIRGRIVGRVVNRRNREPIAAAVEAAGIRAGQVVADVGFGGGVGLGLLLDRVGQSGMVHGFEISTTMIDGAQRRFRREVQTRRLSLTAAPMEALPVPDASIDALISTNTIYFIDDVFAAFSELNRILAGNGCAVLGIADPDALRAMPFTQYGFHVREFDAIVDELQRAGLHVEERIRAGSVDFPYWLLVARKSGVR